MAEKGKVLNPQVESFCVHYTTIGAESFARAEKSAIAAGYSEKSGRNVATDLLKKPEIQQRISELHKANMQRNNITVDKVLADLEHDKLLAREKGDIASAIRADELQGKYLAMFTDRMQAVEPERVRELEERERAELIEIARIRLMEKYSKPATAGKPVETLPMSPQPVTSSNMSMRQVRLA